jgi:hypothetical protein
LALNDGKPCLTTDEYPLFTDAWITGDAAQGPYRFLNTVPRHDSGLIQPAIVLRCDLHGDFPLPDMTKTDTSRYHGGSFPEEVSALSSLALGIRLRAGGPTRLFEAGGDPKGRPIEWVPRPFTTILIRKEALGWVLPNAAEGTHPLDGLGILRFLIKLSRPDATALVRAARLYQDALWLVESEPSLAWLMLVSAVETAANQWRKSKEAPVDRLRTSKPGLYQYLANIGPEVPERVAEEVAESLGSTKKFVDFVLEFLPPPPSGRPPEAYQHPWDSGEIRETVRCVYGHRSRALHDGIPFPAPMSRPPFTLGWATPSERPTAFAASECGGSWLAKDTPIFLHTFEYIVRGVLLEWWRQGAPKDSAAAPHSGAPGLDSRIGRAGADP